MQEFIIKSIVGAELYKVQAGSLKNAVEKAVKSGADLYGADLYGADLSSANLHNANLRSANLHNANLRSADLYGADLYGADLSGADLHNANLRSANLHNANLRSANLYSADLYGADLYGADLHNANLHNANLRSANLYGADLYGADLYGADLSGAKNIRPERITPLLMLHDQTGPIRLYKLVDADLCSPIAPGNGHDGIHYEIGAEYVIDNPDRDPNTQCGAGINVATLDWCLKEHQPGWRVLIVEFTAADIACIPTATDGKLRLARCRIVGEKDISALLSAESA